MFRFKDISIGRKLIIIQVVTAGGAVLLCLIAFLYIDSGHFLEIKEEKIQSTANIIAGNSISPLDFRDNDAALEVLQSLKVEPSILNAAVFDSNGKEFAAFFREKGQSFAFQELELQTDSILMTDESLVIRKDIVRAKEVIGVLYIRTDNKDLQARKSQLWEFGLIIMGLGLLFAFLLAIVLRRAIAGPIQNLAGKMNRVAQTGDYTDRMQESRKDELGTLARRFDEMLEKIAERDKALKEANTGLEKRVLERTQALKIANEELQEKASELRDYAKDLEQYFFIFSHDLKTPLRAISNLSHWIEEDLGENINEEVKEKMDLLRDRVNLFEIQLNALLEYSGIESATPSISEIEPRPLLQKLCNKLDPDGKIPWKLEGNFPGFSTDSNLFSRAVELLLQNAMEYGKGLEIILGCDQNSEAEIVVWVQDKGPGIAPNQHSRIFRIFQTLHQKGAGKGVGAGLAIFQRIVRKLGGELSLESEEGKGTKIGFILPP